MNHQCETCGVFSDDVEWLLDPFLMEIYGEGEYGYWCDNCYAERHNDV